ncbi:orotidine-5'-phosphate decarboxylase [Buchnera aphidicola]|uniref:Orotidine 5'-phosphate decarboxylase n=1 Tax=Buchnera aphidicola subsp. Melaphis rhois TaxID=118103 RepID=A0A4D6Y2Z2_BUCMH|nr:orotidine-5'-phosphate decarboxylase [Buchnera aphidicola]QCI23279.1 orotidine-5'-phosphate decarboxylase [Buchnera aphidicola (Melaphis rhois)]
MTLLNSFKSPTIIIALDFYDKTQAMNLINNLDPKIYALKIGKIMFTLFGHEFIRTLHKMKFNVFLDLKFHDIPNTVFGAVKAAADLGVWMISVHICGGLKMLQSAKLALEPFQKKPLLMGVTILTSLNEKDIRTIGINMSTESYVLMLSKLAKKCSLDGIICPGQTVLTIKKELGDALKILTPGIRFQKGSFDDQKNVITPKLAKKYNIDYIVLGRSITSLKDPLIKLRNV